jgi:D-arabinose 1-dehydrogenase-like Zn-dependent alcohol dehydrogenase
MPDKLATYRRVEAPLPLRNRLWPLYGAGMEKLGRDGQIAEEPMPVYGADELLVRHDACGLCFSDFKVIQLGPDHPRIYRDMQAQPVTLGHEVSMTVVGVGDDLRARYEVGDRFIVQADIFVDGVGYAYGYEIQGGLSQYSVIDQRILNGDHGNYLIPVLQSTGYAESALTEPWACVIAAYRLQYRTRLKSGGTTWLIGTAAAKEGYTISAGFDAESHPAQLLLTSVPAGLAAWLNGRAAALGIQVLEVSDLSSPPVAPVDDIVLLGAEPDVIEAASPHLAALGVMALVADSPMARTVALDIGRVHYNRWVFIGGPGPDIARVYGDQPVRSSLRPDGQVWFVGAGGPMGRMHVQRAVQSQPGPAAIVCTDISDSRLDDLCLTFSGEAEANGIEWICLNPTRTESYEAGMAPFCKQGFDDIVVLVPVPAVITDAATYLAPGGVMNIFAGVAQGTLIDVNLSEAYLNGTRIIGHSASTIDDLRLVLNRAEAGQLSPNRSVAAIGSLRAAKDGLEAVQETRFPGKIVIYPNIQEMPLTALPDLEDELPSVYSRLRNGREWTAEAEEEFLRLMLP